MQTGGMKLHLAKCTSMSSTLRGKDLLMWISTTFWPDRRVQNENAKLKNK